MPLPQPGIQITQFEPAVAAELQTGVTGFLGFKLAHDGSSPPQAPESRLYTSWHDFAYDFRDGDRWRGDADHPWHPDELLWHAVQGFFGNGGERCHVVFYDRTSTGVRELALDQAIQLLAEADEVDLVCAPSLLGAVDPGALQRQLVASSAIARAEHRADWFLILDGPNPRPPIASPVRALEADLASWLAALRATNAPLADAALYHQWIVPGGDHEPAPAAAPNALALGVPPSGHLAGVYARTDRRVGVYKAPANEEILGVVDLVTGTPGVDGVNELLALPGRGIRAWGARTLAEVASSADPDGWINIRRLMLMLKRWLARALEWTVFEAHDLRLWVRVHRELEAKLTDLFLRGAFKGRSPDEAFRIKCDEENNPADARAAGRLQVDVQVAPAAPQQFIQIRLIRSAEGLTVE
jgi:hypothetical protein